MWLIRQACQSINPIRAVRIFFNGTECATVCSGCPSRLKNVYWIIVTVLINLMARSEAFLEQFRAITSVLGQLFSENEVNFMFRGCDIIASLKSLLWIELFCIVHLFFLWGLLEMLKCNVQYTGWFVKKRKSRDQRYLRQKHGIWAKLMVWETRDFEN